MKPWHTVELPSGEIVQGRVDYRGDRGLRFLVPQDLTGKEVIDFGTWDGFWAIEALKRGASNVVAADRWSPMLETAKKTLGAYPEIFYFWTGDLDFPLIWDCGQDGFDYVFFFGILYHLKNPYQGLLNAAMVCKPGGRVIVESAVSEGSMRGLPEDIPLMWVIDRVHHDDPSNYHMPNMAAVRQLCRMVGLNPLTDCLHETRYTVVCEKGGATP